MATYDPWGDYVKVEFSDEGTGIGQWMWVRAEVCDDKRKVVIGRLDNEPLNDYDGKLEQGSPLVSATRRSASTASQRNLRNSEL